MALRIALACVAAPALAGTPTAALPPQPTADNGERVLDVYKSPSCGCCSGWIDHLQRHGFTVHSHHPDDLDTLKQQLGVAPALQSCHTAVSGRGYVFEGHIPAPVIRRFLAAPPAGARGLAVPGMPIGSPGMESGTAFQPYQVLLLGDEGTSVYTTVRSPQDQRDAAGRRE